MKKKRGYASHRATVAKGTLVLTKTQIRELMKQHGVNKRIVVRQARRKYYKKGMKKKKKYKSKKKKKGKKKKTAAQIYKQRLKNLKKARAARKRNLGY